MKKKEYLPHYTPVNHNSSLTDGFHSFGHVGMQMMMLIGGFFLLPSLLLVAVPFVATIIAVGMIGGLLSGVIGACILGSANLFKAKLGNSANQYTKHEEYKPSFSEKVKKIAEHGAKICATIIAIPLIIALIIVISPMILSIAICGGVSYGISGTLGSLFVLACKLAHLTKSIKSNVKDKVDTIIVSEEISLLNDDETIKTANENYLHKSYPFFQQEKSLEQADLINSKLNEAVEMSPNRQQ
jgi:hypothetical protein